MYKDKSKNNFYTIIVFIYEYVIFSKLLDNSKIEIVNRY